MYIMQFSSLALILLSYLLWLNVYKYNIRKECCCIINFFGMYIAIFSCKHFSKLKVLGHGHVFEVWILISSGSDIIIQIRTRGFGVI